MVYCPNVVVGWRSGVRRRRLCVRCEGCCSSNIPHTEHIVYAPSPRISSLLQRWTTHHIAVTTVLRSWRWSKDCPKHVELIQRSIKFLLLHQFGHLYYSPTLMMHGQTQIKSKTYIQIMPDSSFSRHFVPWYSWFDHPRGLVVRASDY